MVPKSDWLLFAVLAFLFWGFWGFFPKIASQYVGAKSLLIYETLGIILVSIPFFLLLGFKLEFHAVGTTFAVLTGIAAALGSFFFFLALKKGFVSVIAPFTALYPLVTVLLAVLILREPLTIKQGVGIFLALVSVLFLAL